MNDDPTDAGNTTPAQKAMKQPSKMRPVPENEDSDPVGPAANNPSDERRVRDADKPVGESTSDGSSPYEQPHHIAKNLRDR
ncbi:MAG: hypothetical protein EOP81_14305 [Variovorax sp.]|nr:MAG: hypothetical protein EOP81_14305 [Variovorax sp.]